LIRRRRK